MSGKEETAMMEHIIIDTNIVIKGLEGDPKAVKVMDGNFCFISFITEIELLSFRGSAAQLNAIKEIISSFIIHPYSGKIQERVIKIRKSLSIKIPDAFIAAAAIDLKMPLFSNDIIFKSINALQFIHVEF